MLVAPQSELAEIYNGTVGRRVTSDLGPLKLQELSGGSDARRKYIRETITRLADEMGLSTIDYFWSGVRGGHLPA